MNPLQQLSRFNLAALSLLLGWVILLGSEIAIDSLEVLAPWRTKGVPLLLGPSTLAFLLALGHLGRPANPPLTLLTCVLSIMLFLLLGIPLLFFVGCAFGPVCL